MLFDGRVYMIIHDMQSALIIPIARFQPKKTQITYIIVRRPHKCPTWAKKKVPQKKSVGHLRIPVIGPANYDGRKE